MASDIEMPSNKFSPALADQVIPHQLYLLGGERKRKAELAPSFSRCQPGEMVRIHSWPGDE